MLKFSGEFSRSWTLLPILALVAFSSSVALAQRERFMPNQPDEVLKTDGGRVRVWSSNFQQLQDADVGASILTVEPQGLSLPRYEDAGEISYVLKGCAHVGLINPFGFRTNARKLREGDLWVTPRGWAKWIWNKEGNEALEIIAVADTSEGPKRAEYTDFHLIGAQKGRFGGILHGFSKDLLSRAWDVEEKEAEQLVEAQKETAIIKISKSQEVDMEAFLAGENDLFGDYIFRLREHEPHVCAKGAGSVRLATLDNWPVLEKVDFAADLVQLERDAIVAPHWTTNSAEMKFVIKGSGRVEIAEPGGKTALREEVKAGDVIVIPSHYPQAMLAGQEGLEWITIYPNSRPSAAFLAGSNSVFRALPKEIQRAAFNADEMLLEKFRRTRREDYILFPPRGKQAQGRLWAEEMLIEQMTA